MSYSFIELTERSKASALEMLETWSEELENDTVEAVLASACGSTLPRLHDVDGDWVMQMMWQVPDLLETTTYSDGMDMNATVRSAVEIKISELIRDEVTERALSLGYTHVPPRL